MARYVFIYLFIHCKHNYNSEVALNVLATRPRTSGPDRSRALTLGLSGVATGGTGARAHLIPLRPPVGFVQNRRVFLRGGGGGMGVEVVKKSSISRRKFLDNN